MDETPVVFDLPYSTTLDLHGTSTVNIRTTGHEKTNFIVILACMAVGSKLPPVCIFKLKKTPRELFPQGVYIRVNEKGWCNEEEMLWWIENMRTQRNKLVNTKKNKQSGQDEVRNVDELGGDDECYDSDYRETDSNNGDTDSEVSNNDSDEVSNDSNDKIDSDINEYEEQEISDYENEFDRLNLFVTQVFLNNE
ncbi:hypothetical protein RclHR1_12120005 [Rhizophagus clarus]|uniref:DDE-1 domain-containing protein n=1 Tax=Rhizophagus clarus TaxID=94130 RepID=A0A2Z6QLF5_9GLOM|nr:hypothetical protein RclHR1_12120005 [Rhizophagus clarus]